MIVGELGIAAEQGCPQSGERVPLVVAKLSTLLGAGVAGVFLWNWVPDPKGTTCSEYFGSDDPLFNALSVNLGSVAAGEAEAPVGDPTTRNSRRLKHAGTLNSCTCFVNGVPFS